MTAASSPRLPLRLGTRGSPLALVQARELRGRLMAAHPSLAHDGAIEIVAIVTSGDREQERSLADIGGKGLFTKEIDIALLDGRIDLAVHSTKDLPTLLPAGIVLACVPEREDPRDGLIAANARTIAELPRGAIVGTASLRRSSLLLHRRPDLKLVPLRGNVETRLRKLDAGEMDATVLAMAGLKRLGLAARASPLSPDEMLPAVGQGAIAVTCRAGDEPVVAWLATINHEESRLAVIAERAFLAVLDGSCRTPIAALAELQGDGLSLRGLVASIDGRDVETVARSGPRADAAAIGRAAGADLLARLRPGFLAAKG